MSDRPFNYSYNVDGPTPPCGKNCPDRAAGCSVTCAKWKAYLEVRNANYAERKKRLIRMAPTAATEKTLANKLTQAEFMKKRNRRK